MAFVSGFSGVSVAPTGVSRRAGVMEMSARPVSKKTMSAARLIAFAPIVSVAPALAEGTGEALGIDSNLLFLPLILIPVAFFVLFAQFGSQQNNEDFFGEKDDRRN
eukprot:CAMPEP_0182450050 /NCGR_PEP_ID=MMETSP1172-20130603/38599_1 /TAXON_ID=708627 /ORGANISM="Timspurckia oligopyrenoides, Strain CCMP3278" /LENGTH=105 /DNA_ID=CAMNT_0024647529 /DNA_START=41 /DNA_END=358 /DNA_ORIENTATION=+